MDGNLKVVNGKVQASLFGLDVNIDWLFIALLNLASQVGDKLVEGDKLSKDQIKGIKTAYAVSKIWGEDAVAKSETELDDKGLIEFIKLCRDTAEEAEFSLAIEG